MNLCSNGHDEVCFEDRKCPVCVMEAEMQRKLDNMGDENNTLLDTIRDLEATIAEQTQEIGSLQQQIPS